MTKYPFTAAGFEALQLELYALPDAALKVQSQLILMDFNGWMEFHFDLSPSQVVFLAGINPETRLFTAFQTSYAVNNRLPVTLVKPAENPNRGGDGEGDGGDGGDDNDGKLIRPKSRLESTSDDEGGFEADGYLEIEILYES